MSDFFEIDFLAVETAKSGDAIALRYEANGYDYVHVVDGGYTETGQSLIDHINGYYGAPTFLDNVVLTHPDSDHACGLKTLLDSEEFIVGNLWMNRPWLYAVELLPHFKNYTSIAALERKLREIYSHTADLETKAIELGIPIKEAFQGAAIGAFTVLAPTKARYLELVLDSPRTPDRVTTKASTLTALLESTFRTIAAAAVNLARAAWGDEVFSTSETSRENEMSIIQYAYLNENKIMLTGDAGREALAEAADYLEGLGFSAPVADKFQVPHHGSRRNVSSEVLDRLLGEKLPEPPPEGTKLFSAIISSAKADPDHPRNAVIRACQHRGGTVVATEGVSRYWYAGVPLRDGWSPSTPLPYPEDQEE